MDAHPSLLKRPRESDSVRSASTCFVYAGALFRVAASPVAAADFLSLDGVSSDVSRAPLRLATIDCSFEQAPAAAFEPRQAIHDRAIHWEWSGGICTLRSPRAQIRLIGIATGEPGASDPPTHFRAVIQALPGRIALAGALSALASAAAAAQGGVALHCASVQWRGSAVGFIGPSGAGKTTACQHMGGAPLFSIDRMLVVPRPLGGYGAFRVPGGTLPSSPALSESSCQSLPLGALLGLSHSPSDSAVQSLSRIGQLALLRQSAFNGSRARKAEDDLLRHLGRLSRHVPVARLHWKLGARLTNVLSEAGIGRAGRHAGADSKSGEEALRSLP